MDLQKHWDRAYQGKDVQKLGWFESHPEKSLELIAKCDLLEEDKIIDVGSGASTLMDALLDAGYKNITAVDISAAALQSARERLGPSKSEKINWLIDDLTKPVHLSKPKNVALWHDRAVLHFLLDEKHRQVYKETILAVLKPGGHVIIAAFAIGGATKCSGLDLYNYDRESLVAFLGAAFKLEHSFTHTYIMPSGDACPYIYTHFVKK
jgi:SAM-dependent methyltransferase